MRGAKCGRSERSVGNSARKRNSPKCNSQTFRGLSEQYGMLLAHSRADGKSADTLEQRVSELSKVVAMKTQGNSDIETQNQTMGVVEGQVQVGSGARNLGSIWEKLKAGEIKTGNSKMYAPSLAAAPALNGEKSF